MSILDEVKDLCDRLAAAGWRDRFLAVTNGALDIRQPTATALQTALTSPLPEILRSIPGFEDFCAIASRAVTAGRPAQSLLYHALASPNVHPTDSGEPSQDLDHYPTLEELECLENYIYSLAADQVSLEGNVIAVLAYQYRTANRTAHGRHADIAFSRTGVARVGLTSENYNPSRRCFWPISEASGEGLAVLPARYGLFLARLAKPGAAGAVQGGHTGALDHDYVFPLHKLFAGQECIAGRDISLGFIEFHRNEKLRRIHSLPVSDGGIKLPRGFDMSKPPYLRDSTNAEKMVSLRKIGASCLVVPEPAETLVRTATQVNSSSGREELVHFRVPPITDIRSEDTRYAESTLKIPRVGADRLAPEYVNIRHSLNPEGPPDQPLSDLNGLEEVAFDKAMREGGYFAAHFVDDSCDGVLDASIEGLGEVSIMPAFSLVTAPDFLPLADQAELDADGSVRQSSPLSKGRLPPNLSLPRPSDPSTAAFTNSDRTTTAVVGPPPAGPRLRLERRTNRMISYLPDAASNIFAPGWDTSRSRNELGTFFTSSGLGSPFPEDAKLCSALASFWPAVAPDNGRTFGNERNFNNQVPMLDEELGFHPDHERVRSNAVESYRGWDGEFGPFFEKVGSTDFVNYVAIERSDYVAQALAGHIRVSLTVEIQSQDLIERNLTLEACMRIPPLGFAQTCLVVFRKIEDWVEFGTDLPQLTGGGFLLTFAELQGDRQASSEVLRVRRRVSRRHVCQVSDNGVGYKNGNAPFVFIPA